MKSKFKSIYVILFIALIVVGYLIINFKDPVFMNAGYVYAALVVLALAAYYFAPRLLKK